MSSISTARIVTVLRNAYLPAARPLDLSGRPDLRQESNGIRQAALYDQLKDGQEVA